MNLREARIRVGLSQQELGLRLARELGEEGKAESPQPRIASYEAGRNSIPLRVAAALVKVINAAAPKAERPLLTLEQLAEAQAEKNPGG